MGFLIHHMKSKPELSTFLVIAISSALTVGSTYADSGTWVPVSGTNNWNSDTNWTNPFPNGIGQIANLSNNITGNSVVNLNTSITLGVLNIGDSNASHAFTINTGTGTNSLIFDNTGTTDAQINRTHGGASLRDIINVGITLNDNLVINNTSTGGTNSTALELAGQITGNKSITLQGAGFTGLLNTTNTYSGGLTLDGGTVMTGSNSAAFGTGALTITSNGGTVNTAVNSGASQLLVTTNENVWNGNLNVAGAMWNNNGNVTLGSNVAITSTGDRYLGLGGNISETGGSRSLTFSTGAGGPALRTPIILSGTNTYTGGTVVNGGILTFMKTASMPTTGNISFATGTSVLGIAVGGTGEWTTTGTGAGTLNGIFNGLGAGGATLSYGAAVSLHLIVTGNQSYGGITNLSSSNNNFTKAGIGTLTITGDNTFGGQTGLYGGGGYTLDYASSNTTKFGSGAVFLGHVPSGTQPHQGYGGGTITLKGGSTLDSLGTFNLNMGGTFVVREDGGTSKLRFNGMNGRTAGGTISFGDALIADIDRLNVNGILGGWATIGNDWAVNSTNAGDGAVTALASYDGALATTGGVATQNNTLTAGQIQVGTTVANTIKISNSGTDQVLALGTNNLTITSAAHAAAATPGGIMYVGGETGIYEISSSTGRITSSTNNQELIFAVQSGTLKVSAIIGAAANGNSPVTKSGAGTLEISSTNTTNGAYYVNQGVLRLASAGASGAAATFGSTGIYVQNNAALELTGGFSFPVDERIMITGSGVSNGGALRSVSGANSWRGLIDIGIGGARINNDDAANTFTIANGSAYSAGLATVAGGSVTFGGVGNTTVSATAGIYGAGGVIKDGTGTLTLSATNTYIGATTISNGTLALGASGTIANSSGIYLTGAGAKFNVTSADFNLGANQTLGGIGTVENIGRTFTAAGTLAPGSSPGTLTVDGGTMALAEGGNYNFQILNATASAGTGYDTINLINGAELDLSALSAGGYTISLQTLASISPDTQGLAANFNSSQNYSWTLFSTNSSLLSAFNANYFLIDTTNFVNGLDGGSFSIGLADSDTNLVLNFTAIPEPKAALLGALGVLLLLRRRR